MFSDMQDWTDIRRQVLVEGASKRAICRQYGIAHKTLQKILAHSEPPGYRQSLARPKNQARLGMCPKPCIIPLTLGGDTVAKRARGRSTKISARTPCDCV